MWLRLCTHCFGRCAPRSRIGLLLQADDHVCCSVYTLPAAYVRRRVASLLRAVQNSRSAADTQSHGLSGQGPIETMLWDADTLPCGLFHLLGSPCRRRTTSARSHTCPHLRCLRHGVTCVRFISHAAKHREVTFLSGPLSLVSHDVSAAANVRMYCDPCSLPRRFASSRSCVALLTLSHILPPSGRPEAPALNGG